MRAWVRLLLVLPLITAGLLLAPAPAAYACSCVSSDPATLAQRAQVVLSGEVLQRRADGPSATYVVAVRRVFKGAATPQEEVRSQASSASCGLELPSLGPVLLYARTTTRYGTDPVARGDQLVADLCGGSRPGSDLPAGLGAGTPPAPVAVLGAPAGARSTAGGPDWRPVLILAGAGLAGPLAVALVLARRHRRRRAG